MMRPPLSRRRLSHLHREGQAARRSPPRCNLQDAHARARRSDPRTRRKRRRRDRHPRGPLLSDMPLPARAAPLDGCQGERACQIALNRLHLGRHRKRTDNYNNATPGGVVLHLHPATNALHGVRRRASRLRPPASASARWPPRAATASRTSLLRAVSPPSKWRR